MKKFLDKDGLGEVWGKVKSYVDSKPHSNPSLLDNGHFADPINQRGQGEYTGAGYTIDRWYNQGAYIVTLLEDGLKITTSRSVNKNFYQPIENPSRFWGKTITATVLVTETSQNPDGVLRFLSSTTVLRNVSIDAPGLYSITYTVPNNLEVLSLGIAPSELGEHMTVLAAKLELGNQQTLAHKEGDAWVLNDPPPNKTLELLKCQRYFQTFATESERPAKGKDFRPVMRTDLPTLSTITTSEGETLYTASSDL